MNKYRNMNYGKVKKMSSEEKVAIEISKPLYEKIKKYLDETNEFSSIEEFVEFVLETVVEEETGAEISEEDEEKVKERLRSLGYL